jgi:hypothetical protein
MSANAQLRSKPVVYYNSTSGEIMNGLPEEFPAPYGFQKIVCTSAREAEQWSERQRKWENFKHSLKQEERALIEGRILSEMRSHMHHLMANARNNINRDFLRRSLENLDNTPEPWKSKRESYLHAEAFENGH